MKRSATPPLMPETTTQNQYGTDMQSHQASANPSPANQSGASQAASLSSSVQKHIGNLLKVSFQDLVAEPVPDRFASLLDQLEQAEKKGK